ncbi:MAG: acyl-CoA dehydrogenase family protein [Sinimarinibacterium sp.]|jgi:alkylation response protein AidB-like acyl-CoA dehydrogenase
MIKDAASRFLKGEYPKLIELGATEGACIWQAFADLGWLALPVNASFDGLGGGLAELSILLEAFGHHPVAHPYLDHVVVARLFQGLPDVPERGQLLAGLLSGTERTVLATREHGDREEFSARSTIAIRADTGWRVSGIKRGVQFGSAATHFIVSARTEGGPARDVVLCRVAAAAVGVVLDPVDRADGGPANVVRFDAAQAEVIGSGASARRVLAQAQAWAMLLSMSEALGAMRQVFELTREYLDAREQYGRKLSAFQALRMRVVDMFMETELAAAYLRRAISQVDAVEDSEAVPLVVLGAKSLFGRIARRIAQDAVQLHGAVGFTQEALPGRFMKRIESLIARFGATGYCTQSYVDRALEGERVRPIDGVFSAPDQAFAAQVRNFVRENLSRDIERKVRTGLPLAKDDYVRWQKALHKQGWIASSWPREFGGTGWTAIQQYIFQSEAGRLNAPDVMPYGIKMVGPVLYTFGTEAQQAEHLPGVLSSDVWWCQGYSEPNAGSDLASLRTRAERQGNHYIVNGTKIWTTQAHYADKMHCLVRTGDPKDRHRTITFLMIDMQAEGVSVRPIHSIDGLHHLNQVFLDNVRVPVAQRVGEEGDGWKIATFLLAHERAALAKVAHKERILNRARQLLERRREQLEASGEMRQVAWRLAQLEIQLHALESLELDYLMDSGESPYTRVYGSILKVAATEVQQQLTELAFDILGVDALDYPRELLTSAGADRDPEGAEDAVAVYEYLYNRAASIYGGTNEIQRTIIARAIFRD